MKYLGFVALSLCVVAVSACDVQKAPTAPAATTADPVIAPKGGGNDAVPSRPPAEWTSSEWHDWFAAVAQHAGQPNATPEAMAALRSALNSVGADWQNGWRGDYRTRIYLPTGFCPPPVNPDVPGCSYEKAVDVGENGMGQPWTWVPRF